MKYDIDCINTHFEIPSLDKIHGEPSYHTLRDLKKQLKANTVQVSSDLGGGANRYLGLVLISTEYTGVNPITYVKLIHLGALRIQERTTQHETTRLYEDYKDAIRIFCEPLDAGEISCKKS